MLDHSRLSALLLGGVSPMDIDAILDHNGTLLAMEFSSKDDIWAALPAGQRRTYEAFVRNGRGRQWAALVRHRAPQEEGGLIDTLDLVSFQLMRWGGDEGVVTSKVYPGKDWGAFVKSWWDATGKEANAG